MAVHPVNPPPMDLHAFQLTQLEAATMLRPPPLFLDSPMPTMQRGRSMHCAAPTVSIRCNIHGPTASTPQNGTSCNGQTSSRTAHAPERPHVGAIPANMSNSPAWTHTELSSPPLSGPSLAQAYPHQGTVHQSMPSHPHTHSSAPPSRVAQAPSQVAQSQGFVGQAALPPSDVVHGLDTPNVTQTSGNYSLISSDTHSNLLHTPGYPVLGLYSAAPPQSEGPAYRPPLTQDESSGLSRQFSPEVPVIMPAWQPPRGRSRLFQPSEAPYAVGPNISPFSGTTSSVVSEAVVSARQPSQHIQERFIDPLADLGPSSSGQVRRVFLSSDGMISSPPSSLIPPLTESSASTFTTFPSSTSSSSNSSSTAQAPSPEPSNWLLPRPPDITTELAELSHESSLLSASPPLRTAQQHATRIPVVGFGIGRNRISRSADAETPGAEPLEPASQPGADVAHSNLSLETPRTHCERSNRSLTPPQPLLSLAVLQDALSEHTDTLSHLCQRHQIFCKPQSCSPYHIGAIPVNPRAFSSGRRCSTGGSDGHGADGVTGAIRHALAGAELEEHLAVHCYLQDCTSAAKELLEAVSAARQQGCVRLEEAVSAPDCAICLCAMTSGLVALSCGHVFHHACIKSAAVRTTRCPVCRMTIGSEPMVLPLFFG
jgi:hypothetical protein